MSLADEFLADLEEIAQNDGEDETVLNKDEKVEIADINDDGIEVNNGEIQGNADPNKKSIKDFACLKDSDRLKRIKDAINDSNNNKTANISVGQLSKEYDLIVESNSLMVDLENEINIIHKYLRDIYNKRFPELESLVTNSYDYIQTVHFLGNIEKGVKVDEIEFLSPAIKMIVSVTISTTIGQSLTNQEVELVDEACLMAASLSRDRALLFEYIQSRMIFIAPNLTTMVGPTIAAQLIGSAGGLDALAKMPSCNSQLIGAQKKNLTGFSSLSSLPNTGILYHSEFIQKLPLAIRKKATRLYSSKCTLAARVDQQRMNQDGEYGEKLMEEVQSRLEKLLEPPAVKLVKALPRPDDFPKRRRGGKRQRKAKEKIALTELRKQANTIKFGQLQEDVLQTEVGFAMGTIGQTGTGKIRNARLDAKTNVSVTKRLQKNLATMNTVYGGRSSIRGQISGTASSVAFTPLKGLEIVNPNAADPTAVEAVSTSTKYFSSSTGFKSTIPKPF